MQTFKEGVASLSLIAKLNLDRFLVMFMIGTSLFAASYVVSI